MQHKAYILYNRNVTQSDGGIYCLHESSCHIQFIKELSIQGTGLAVCSKTPLPRTSVWPSTAAKQTTCIKASLLPDSSGVCVMMSFLSYMPPHLLPGFFLFSVFTRMQLKVDGSHGSLQTKWPQRSLSNHVIISLRNFSLHQLICPGATWAQVSTEVGMERQASVQQPNLLAAIDIPFSSVSTKLLCIQRLSAKPRASSLWPVILIMWLDVLLFSNHWILDCLGNRRGCVILGAFQFRYFYCVSFILGEMQTNLAVAV